MKNLAMKKHYLVKVMKGFENYYKTRITNIESQFNNENVLNITMQVNHLNDPYLSRFECIETIVEYNLDNNSIKVKPLGKGSRKYNKELKYNATIIIEGLINEADQYYIGDCSEADFMTRHHYYKQMKEAGAAVETTNQFDYDCRHTFNTVEEIHNNFLSIMNELTTVKEVAATIIEDKQDITENIQETTYTAFNRSFNTYEEAVQYCNESDFSTEYIEEVVTGQPSTTNISNEVKSFINNIEYTNTLENIAKIQNMPFVEVETMLISHFERYKKHSLTNEEVAYIIDQLNRINVNEILNNINFNPNAIVEFEKVNYTNKYLNVLNESLERFITYAARYIYDQKEHGTVRSEYNKYLELAIHLRNNLHNIAEHVHKHCFNYDEVVYPGTMLQSLYNYRSFCYNNTTSDPYSNFNSLEQQNENTRKYVHYDFSVKRIKTIA